MQKSVAITNPNSSSLVSVEVETKDGDLYSFPAMDVGMLRQVLPQSKDEEPRASQPTLAMVNASYAVLSIPYRIIKSIRVGSEELWCSPA